MLQVLDFYEVKHHLKKNHVIIDFSHYKNPIGRNVTCGTGDCFVEDKTQYYGEVVDMEELFIGKDLLGTKIPFVSYKYITDGSDEQAHEDWGANLKDGIKLFKEKIL